mgnify:CR=1 FL=1
MPDYIQLLPDAIANQIAAGEVVQRPASALKELLENAVDAGATQIQVVVKDAGKQLIQVIDNGKGMSPTDARMSFERHATSKIRTAQDLFAIRTFGFRGEAMAMGERPPIAIFNAGAAARITVGEAITNILSADITDVSHIKLSANWMASCGTPGEDAKLFEAVYAIGMELCPELGISIPVGKDSLSMQTKWSENGSDRSVTSPVSLIISAFTRITSIRYPVQTPFKVIF